MADIDALIERATLLLEQNRYQAAEQEIKKVLEIDPQHDFALSVLARCYMNSGQHDKGIEVINKAIAIEPNESFYFYLLGFGYYQKNQFLPAKDSLIKAVELDPYHAEYFGLLSHIFLDEKMYKEALDRADEGLELDPENVTCLNARSRALSKLKRTDEATESMGDTLSKDPDNKYSHATVGWNYFENGNHKKAEHHFREALRIDPNFESARIGLKESLKSHFTPYKLVVQFSLWMSEKGKNFQWIFFIGIYVIFRIVRSVAASNEKLKPFLLPLIVFYFVFIFFTWIANPLANFFLLFHKDGKYSVTKSESAIGITTVTLLVSGIALACYAYYFFPAPPDEIIYPAIVLATMSIPVSKLDLPINIRSGSIKVWYPLGLLIAGIISVLAFLINPEMAFILAIIYAVALLIFTWVANAWD
jgi:tetratricopeptide (TPR) repeat protein